MESDLSRALRYVSELLAEDTITEEIARRLDEHLEVVNKMGIVAGKSLAEERILNSISETSVVLRYNRIRRSDNDNQY